MNAILRYPYPSDVFESTTTTSSEKNTVSSTQSSTTYYASPTTSPPSPPSPPLLHIPTIRRLKPHDQIITMMESNQNYFNDWEFYNSLCNLEHCIDVRISSISIASNNDGDHTTTPTTTIHTVNNTPSNRFRNLINRNNNSSSSTASLSSSSFTTTSIVGIQIYYKCKFQNGNEKIIPGPRSDSKKERQYKPDTVVKIHFSDDEYIHGLMVHKRQIRRRWGGERGGRPSATMNAFDDGGGLHDNNDIENNINININSNINNNFNNNQHSSFVHGITFITNKRIVEVGKQTLADNTMILKSSMEIVALTGKIWSDDQGPNDDNDDDNNHNHDDDYYNIHRRAETRAIRNSIQQIGYYAISRGWKIVGVYIKMRWLVDHGRAVINERPRRMELWREVVRKSSRSITSSRSSSSSSSSRVGKISRSSRERRRSRQEQSEQNDEEKKDEIPTLKDAIVLLMKIPDGGAFQNVLSFLI